MTPLYRAADALLTAVLWFIALGGVALAWATGLLVALVYALALSGIAAAVACAAWLARQRRP